MINLAIKMPNPTPTPERKCCLKCLHSYDDTDKGERATMCKNTGCPCHATPNKEPLHPTKENIKELKALIKEAKELSTPEDRLRYEWRGTEMYQVAVQTYAGDKTINGEIEDFFLSKFSQERERLVELVNRMFNHDEMMEMEGLKYTEGYEKVIQSFLALISSHK